MMFAPLFFDGAGRVVVGIDAHTAGAEDHVHIFRAHFRDGGGDVVQPVAHNGVLGHADAERGQLLFQNGREGVLNAATGDLAAGRDDGSGFQPVGQQLKDRLACGDAVGGVELFPL